MTNKIVFTPPGRNDPGYLRRMRRALEMKTLIKQKEIAPEHIDSIIEFLLGYVTEPENRDQARELLWDASEEDFLSMLTAISGDMAQGNPTKPTDSTSTGT
jgi:hypothetical protein